MFEDVEGFGGDFDIDAVVVAAGFINAVFLLSVRDDFIAESEDVAILVCHFLKVLFAEFQNGFFSFFVGTKIFVGSIFREEFSVIWKMPWIRLIFVRGFIERINAL